MSELPTEEVMRLFVSYWLDDHSPAKIDALVEDLPSDEEVARWVEARLGEK